MIARLIIQTPFLAVVPEGAQFPLGSYDDGDYRITFHPPCRTDAPSVALLPETVTIADEPAFVANGLRVDFQKKDFDRQSDAPLDPPEEIIKSALDTFLIRLRYVTRAHQVTGVPFPLCDWRIQYLNDDETPLAEVAGLLRGRFSKSVNVSLVHINPDIYHSVLGMEPDLDTIRWHDLLLDATAALPRVGTALVLGATALEVFIADLLNRMAQHSGLSEDLWQWINDRDDYTRDPSTEEQFDVLLKHFTGHSLKEKSTLWEAFKNLRTARNKFVHEGAAKIGGVDVTAQKAAELVGLAHKIVSQIREWLPSEVQWPVFEHHTTLNVTFPLFPEKK